MLTINGYNLQSFAIGAKHVRAFSVANCTGTITDFVLAECGAEKSPFPVAFYKRITTGDGVVKLQDSDDTVSYTVTRDNIVLSQRTAAIDKELDAVDMIVKQAKHIMPSTLAFINQPKAKRLGMVWQFTEKETRARERFRHPVAKEICDGVLKFKLNSKEYPAESNVRLAFRKKLSNSYLMKGQNDFFNIIITIGDQTVNDFWPDTEETNSRMQIVDDTRVGFVSIDAQIIFDPRRKVTEKVIEGHWAECQRVKSRISELLKGVGFGTG